MKAVLIAATLALAGCQTLDGVGARLAASDVSILDAALFLRDVADMEFDPQDRSDRIVLYRALDSVVRHKRGEITLEQALAEVHALVLEQQNGGF